MFVHENEEIGTYLFMISINNFYASICHFFLIYLIKSFYCRLTTMKRKFCIVFLNIVLLFCENIDKKYPSVIFFFLFSPSLVRKLFPSFFFFLFSRTQSGKWRQVIPVLYLSFQTFYDWLVLPFFFSWNLIFYHVRIIVMRSIR